METIEDLQEVNILSDILQDFKTNWRDWSDKQLIDFIYILLEVKIPDKILTTGHSSPAQFICDAFFERFATALVIANRTGGKTFNVAIINILNSIAKDNCESTQAGATRDQAKKGYEYFKAFSKSEAFYNELESEPTQQETKFKNNSKVGVITGSAHGLRSPHPQKACLDEVDLMDWSTLQTGFSMAQTGESSDGTLITSQNICTSTRNSTEGTVQRLLNESESRGIKLYKWNIFEVLEPCTRECKNDKKFGNCPAYTRLDIDGKEVPMCGGLAHQSDGYYQIEDFINKVRNLDYDRWVFEWLCDTTVSGKQVYGKYYKDEAPYICKPFVIPKDWRTWMSRDSGQHSRVYKFTEDPVSGIWYIIWALILDDNQLYEDQVRWIKESPMWKKSEPMYCDPADPQAIEEFRRRKINALKANNKVLAGIDSVKQRLSKNWSVKKVNPIDGKEKIIAMPGLVIFNTLKSLREGMLRYSHPEKDDGTFNEDEIIKDKDHDVDCLRYGVFSKIEKISSNTSYKFFKRNW